MKAKTLIPHTAISVNSEIEKLRNQLLRGESVILGNDGSIISANNRATGDDGYEKKTKFAPNGTILGASEENAPSVRDMINQMRGEVSKSNPASNAQTEKTDSKTKIAPGSILGSE